MISTMLFVNRHESPTPPQKILPHQTPRLSFFISRNNGNIVPLIPADELPYSVRLSGVQRVMKMENTCGMQHVGNLPFTGQYFRLEAEPFHHTTSLNANSHKSTSTNGVSTKKFLAPDAMVRYKTVDGSLLSAPLPAVDQTVTRQLPASTTASTWRRQGDANSTVTSTAQATIDAIIASEPRPVRNIRTTPEAPKTPSSSSRNGSNTPDSGDKVYCTHWIRHGECDYIQQGCRYKHEMPDKATLASIGFRTVPRWWQEKVAVKLGQSAIPTISGLKPSEWMKTKKGSSGSGESCSGDDTSESGFESDESGAESEVEVDEDTSDTLVNTAKAIHSAAVTKPMTDHQPEKKAALAPSKKITEALPTMQALQPTLNTSTRKLSLTGSDLIDFSPADATSGMKTNFPSSASTATHEPRPKLSVPPPATVIESPNKQSSSSSSSLSTSPRKIFVPAGESKEYHIAQSRRKNAAVPATEQPTAKLSLGGGQIREAVAAKQIKQQRNYQHQLANLPNFTKGGLMASVHAPTMNVTSNPTTLTAPSPPHAGRQFAPKQQQQQQQHRHRQTKKSKSGHGSRSVSSSSSSPGGSSNGLKTPETRVTASVKGPGEAEPAPKEARPIIPTACRPRRPAGMAGKVAGTHSKQTAKVAAGVGNK